MEPDTEEVFLIPEEERVLSLAYLVPESADVYQNEIKDIPLMDPEQARFLAEKVQAGKQAASAILAGIEPEIAMELGMLEKAGQAAKWQLVLYHLRFAAYLARRSMGVSSSRKAPQGISTQLPNYRDSILPLSDRIQAANIGLEKAAESYQPNFVDEEGAAHKANFTTYASYSIQRELILALHREHPHLTSEVIKKGGLFRRREEELTQELGRVPTLDELVRTLGWDEELEARMMKTGLYASRLTFKSMGPLKRQPRNLGNEGEGAELENRDFIERALVYVNPRYRAVLTLRYGLLDGQEMTLEEVGEVLGVTLERIRQIEERALNQIRKALLSETGVEGGPDSMPRLRKQIWD